MIKQRDNEIHAQSVYCSYYFAALRRGKSVHAELQLDSSKFCKKSSIPKVDVFFSRLSKSPKIRYMSFSQVRVFGMPTAAGLVQRLILEISNPDACEHLHCSDLVWYQSPNSLSFFFVFFS